MLWGYSHLEAGSSDLHKPFPLLLVALNLLGEHLHKTIVISSARRTLAKQAQLYADRASNPYPVAPPTPNDPHVEGVSVDASIDGVDIQNAVPEATLEKFGLQGLPGDTVHVQLAGTLSKSAAQIRAMAKAGRFKLTAAQLKKFGVSVTEGGALGGNPGDTVKQGVNAITGAAGDAVGGVASAVIDGIVNALGINAIAILLNLALVGGGAFLIIFGLARALGVRHPVGAAAKTAAVAAV